MVLFRLRGVPVIVGWSWLVVLGLVFWSLGWAVFPAAYPHLSTTTYAVMAAVTALLFFASVLAHELSHTLTTLREGVRVREIRLWLFGGVSAAEDPLPGPGSEFRVVAAGPATTAVLAGAFLGLALLARQVDAPTPWVAAPDYLARLNGLLLAFNLVPALPLDGGRLLHALLWWRSRDSDAATVYAGAAGRAFALVLILVGAIAMITGNSLGGLWFVLIGWFLLQSVRQEVLAARAAHAFKRIRVRQLMTPSPTTLDPQMNLEELAELLGRGAGHPLYPVVDQGHLTGVLLVRDAGAVPVAARPSSRIDTVMRGRDAVPVVDADAPASDAVDLLRRPPGRALVTDRSSGDTVVGVISPDDLERALGLAARTRWPRRGNWTAVAIAVVATLGILVGAAALYHPPLAVVAPGDPVDVAAGLRIGGVPSAPVHGHYLATPVSVSQPSVLGLLDALVRGGRKVTPVGAVLPVAITAERLTRWQQAAAYETRLAAEVAAARASGRVASLSGRGVRVVALTGDAAVTGVLRMGDRVTSLDGVRVHTTSGLAAQVAARAGEQRFALTVVRDGRTVRLQVPRIGAPVGPGVDGLGLVGETVRLRAHLPVPISAPAAAGLGPSAGLALALAVTDRLEAADLARGRTVAAAGLVSADGRVVPVGASSQRVSAALEAGADLFVSASPAPRVVTHGPLPGAEVDSVPTAVRVLRAP
jgi:PDZ domain-containing secreted protein/Zn-dependent protease